MAKPTKQSYRGCGVQNNHIFHIFILLTSVIVSGVGMSHAAELPPLTHKLTAFDKPIKAPTLRLQNMDQEIVDIKDLKGKVVVVNFWATWCPPCRREMGALERLHLATKDKNIVILAVNIGEDIDTVFSFMGTVDPSPSFPILFDPNADTMKRWKVRGLPTTYIINPNGNIVFRAIGGREFDHPDIQHAIMNLRNRVGSTPGN